MFWQLSPALRNRFTEIWCPQSMDQEDLIAIIDHNIVPGLSFSSNQEKSICFGAAIMDFVTWFSNSEIGKRFETLIFKWLYKIQC